MRILVGLIGFPLGMLLVIYRERVKRFTGSMGWAEHYFGVGGTFTALAIIGLLISIGSIMYMFGTIQAVLSSILAPFFPQ